jgi:ribose 5-phosphate isomerase B
LKISLGCDHGGIDLKNEILPLLDELGHEVCDVGTYSNDSVDYPKFAKAVCQDVLDEKTDRGILVCGTGIGMSMAANRYAGIRAALCNEIYTARMSREHNDSNVLCLGARVIGTGLALEIIKEWLAVPFAGERHLRRIEMF